jgi:hypothetical protein
MMEPSEKPKTKSDPTNAFDKYYFPLQAAPYISGG